MPKKIHILESQYVQAGTDFPYFNDEKTETSYGASWNTDYGFPFGYWPIDYDGTEEFCVGDAYKTHANACGKAAERYFMNAMMVGVEEDAYNLEEMISNLLSDIDDYGYTYDEDTDMYVSADGSDEFDLNGKVDEIRDQLYRIPYDYVRGYVEEAIENHQAPSSDEITSTIMDSYKDNYDFSDQEGIDEAMREIGSDFQTFFEEGRGEGRVWPYSEIISFYPTEQPNPYELDYILRELGNSNIGVTYQTLLDFIIIFEDGNNDWTVTACTVSDYMSGNYGENEDDEDEEDYDDEEEIQYARQGKTQFVPHLASPQQKREYFKDFRDTRNRAVYTPKEKAVGNLAAYHAMRYPYGENKETPKKIHINESKLKLILPK